MKRNYFEILIGLAVVLIAAYFFIYTYTKTGQQATEKNYFVKAKFSNISGILRGSDVMISGVKIGAVQEVELNRNTYMAEITLKISDKIKLPKDSAVSILSAGLMGGKYISISPGSEEEILKDGDIISYTQSSINLEDIINKVVTGLTKRKSE